MCNGSILNTQNDARTLAEHIKLVQEVISRMGKNSMQMKTWAVSIVTTAFIFSGLSDDPHWLIGVGVFIPVIAFWTLDARYLRLERCFIKLHEEIVAGNPITPFDLDYSKYVSGIESTWRVAWSWSVIRFYVALLLAALALVGVLLWFHFIDGNTVVPPSTSSI